MRALGDCSHALTVEEGVWDTAEFEWVTHRRCLLCGVSYDRQSFLAKLERAIRDRWRLGRSPWTSAELADEADL